MQLSTWFLCVLYISIFWICLLHTELRPEVAGDLIVPTRWSQAEKYSEGILPPQRSLVHQLGNIEWKFLAGLHVEQWINWRKIFFPLFFLDNILYFDSFSGKLNYVSLNYDGPLGVMAYYTDFFSGLFLQEHLNEWIFTNRHDSYKCIYFVNRTASP